MSAKVSMNSKSRGGERVEHLERSRFVNGPPEDVSSEAEGTDGDIGIVPSRRVIVVIVSPPLDHT